MKNLSITFILISLLSISCAGHKKVETTTVTDSLKEDIVETSASSMMNEDTLKMETYKVKKGDTLMWISFKLYGDHQRWREILKRNPILNQNRLTVGDELEYETPSPKFVRIKNGSPYRIIRGDTLGKISKKLYGTNQKWRGLWNNNLQMIQDPNIIFAGFTIFYPNVKELAKLSRVKK
jgi:nucleoid-associated protein YgaU